MEYFYKIPAGYPFPCLEREDILQALRAEAK
jgi:hypothetical protein